MEVKVITDNLTEKIEVKWDGEIYALVRIRYDQETGLSRVIILNPREMNEVVKFVEEVRV